MKIKLAIAGMLLTLGLVAPASAHVPFHGGWGGSNWDFIGAREVQHATDHDRIFAAGHRQYSQVKVCVYNRAIRLYDLDVVFRNGGHQDVSTRNVLRPGDCTRAIDLNGYRRDIRFLSMVYETTGRNFGPRAFVKVFAR
ncbi:MAG: hypothetical protein ABL973_03275 [Micropepsaceae bacterium]